MSYWSCFDLYNLLQNVLVSLSVFFHFEYLDWLISSFLSIEGFALVFLSDRSYDSQFSLKVFTDAWPPSSCHSTLACMETIKYSCNLNSKPHKWSVILASLPQRENKALCPITNRWRFHGSCGLRANGFPFLRLHFKKGEKSSKRACIEASWNKRGDLESSAQSRGCLNVGGQWGS